MCEACKAHPQFHSFHFVGETIDGISIFYSKPSLNVEIQFREEDIPMYLAHMDEASVRPWMWIFDAADLDTLEIPNPFLLIRFYKLVSQRYASFLQRIVFFHCNWKVKVLLSMIRPFVSREQIVELTSPLELTTLGLSMDLLSKLQ
jgi:hypothetical protein